MNPKDDHPERRKSTRIKKNFILSYYNQASPETKFAATQLKNIGMGGVCFITSQQYKPGAIIGIELKTPYLTGTTHLEGTVLESHERLKGILYETRMTFNKLSPQAEFVIEKIVDYFKEGDRRS